MTEPRLLVRFAGGPYPGRPQPTVLSFDPAVLARPLTELSGVGPALARRLSGLGISTVGDLVEHFPRRYDDYRNRKRVGELRIGEEATVRGTVQSVTVGHTARRRIAVVKAVISDESGALQAVWYNRGYLAKLLTDGMTLNVRGTLKMQGGRPVLVVKTHEILEDESDLVHTEGMVAVYPASEEVSARKLRDLVHQVTPLMRRLPDPLPAALRAAERLPARADAVAAIHAPGSLEAARTARTRLVLEELLLLQVGLLLHKRRERRRAPAPVLPPAGDLCRRFLADLPFALTDDQIAAIDEIDRDLDRPEPMRRLLQGDVGSGKTVVALRCLLRAVEGGFQGALMAPTESLAAQHDDTLAALAGPLARSVLLRAGMSAAERRTAIASIASGEADIVVGTHALLQEDVVFRQLALVVVDEQHRFGVAQRDELARRAARGGVCPHILYMTATPIPRTLALTAYGDLDVTTISAGPAGRRPVVTRLVDESQRPLGYQFVRRQLDKGRQAYVVCPAIEESEAIAAATALAEAERLSSGEFQAYRVAVLHGQMKAAERDTRMAAFKAREIDVLVATSLVEVGIDVPNASVMLVEGAERFGLAQLHQLRGRVGRGTSRSYCLLFSHAETGPARERLAALLDTTDGFALADRDLELRGEGQLMGTRQAGLPDLHLARLSRDRALVMRARELAETLIADDPDLAEPAHVPLAVAVRDAFGGRLAWLLKA